MLVSHIEFTENGSLGEEPANSVLKLACRGVSELSQILVELNPKCVCYGSLDEGALQEPFCVLDEQDPTLEAQIGHVEEQGQ